MKEVGANSDIHWVLFDEENRAVGFHANSRGNQIYMSSGPTMTKMMGVLGGPHYIVELVNVVLHRLFAAATIRALRRLSSIYSRRLPLSSFLPPPAASLFSSRVPDANRTPRGTPHLSLPSSTSGHSESSVRIVFDEFPHGAITDTSLDVGVRHGPTFRSLKVDPLSVDSIEGHNQVSGKGFPTTGPRIEAGNVVINRALRVSNVIACCSLCAIGCKELSTDRHRCSGVLYIVVMLMGYVVDWNCMSMNFKVLRLGVSFGITRLIRASFGITRLIRASFGITRLICASCGITRLIDASFGITRLIRAPFGVRVQRGADQREAGRMREGHMDASGFLYASADVFC
ncbi:hypothetical protein E5676_scaffold318G00020 [Cucumis melo var. makuwa]|uniref:Mucin-19-like n=1 Tax=Cucumis melo var. makuwa TaxID=1194695 RepID=A0A5D3DEB8_CUCMM|nr:hypothetical protein E5676_scaffold318G00020 [Cucumis melo var. makuwa]